MNTEKKHVEFYFNGEFFPNWHIFIFLAIINFLIAFLASQFIFTKDFYYTIFSRFTIGIGIETPPKI